jgi:hypothetical protein
MQLRASTCSEQCSALEHSITVADFHTIRDGHPSTYDLGLVVTVANAMPEIIAVLRAADELCTMGCTCSLIPSMCAAHDPAQDDIRTAMAALESKVANG